MSACRTFSRVLRADPGPTLETPEPIAARVRQSRQGGTCPAARGTEPEAHQAHPPPTPPRPLKRFIQTRYNGVLIGEPRLDPIGTVSKFVDIKSPITGQVLATFHEKTPGMWVEHIETSPAQATSTALTLHDATTAGENYSPNCRSFKNAPANKPTIPRAQPLASSTCFTSTPGCSNAASKISTRH